MKPEHTLFGTALLVISALGLQYSSAADLYWDANGASANVGGTGDWTGGDTWRDGSDTGTLGAWADNNVAIHTSTGGTLTVNSNVAVDGLKLGNADNFVVASSGGSVLTFNNVANNLGVASQGLISATLAGTLNIYTNGTPGLGGPLLTGTNTGVTATNVGLQVGNNAVRINNAAALGSASATVKVSSGFLTLDNGITYNPWATELAGGGIRVRNATSQGGGNPATSTYAGNLTLTGNAALSVRAAANNGLITTGTVNLNANTLTLTAGDGSAGIDIQNAISGSGNITLTQSFDTLSSGTGVSKLSAANSFSGTATVTRGTLALNHVNALQNATLNTGSSATNNTVTFTVAGTNTYHIGGLAGSDDLAIDANTLSVGAKAGTYSYAAAISGTGGLTKVGSGSTQTLAGTNTYEGATSVNEGTLAVTGSISSSVVVVNNDGTVLASGSSGNIGKGVTVNNGAILASGGKNAVGTATVGSDGLNFATGSIFEWDLIASKDANGAGGDDGVGGTDFDSVSVGGNLAAATTGAIFKVVFGASVLTDINDTGNAFWNTPYGTQTWNMSAIFGKTFDTNAFTTVQTSTDVGSFGSFSITGSTLT